MRASFCHKHSMPAVVAALWISASASAQYATQGDAMQAIAQSHIEANVPDASSFDSLLRRDLAAFFHAIDPSSPSKVDYKLLRNGPTQTGVSYPKFYLWATAKNGSGIVHEGAVRVAAVEKTRFEVTRFISKAEILKAPQELQSVFPAPLVAPILELAKSN
jgi:hypothetical protein